jgi:hypothetical protein
MQEVSNISIKEVLKSTTQQTTVADTITHSLLNLLERPTIVHSGLWQTSDVATVSLVNNAFVQNPPTPLVELDFPQAIIASNPVVADKLANFQFLKADLEIEIKTNATPFQQGSLLIIYNPYGASVNPWRETSVRHTTSLTSFPHTIINLQTGTSALMKLPYANTFDMFDLTNTDDQFGRIEIYPLTGLKSALENTKVDLQVYARFVNPIVHTATNKGLALNKNHIDRILNDTRNKKFVDDFYTTKWIAQMDDSKPLGTVASTISKISGKVSGIAEFVKPIFAGVSNMVINFPGRFMGNGDGIDYSVNCALSSTNAVKVNTIVPENVDEMSIKHILSKPNVIYKWKEDKTTFSQERLMYSFENKLHEPTNDALFSIGSFAYTCLLAKFWRGSINYKLTMVKTSFHAGRFAIIYCPEPPPSLIGDLLSTNYSIVVDLATPDAEISFTVPYMSNIAWKRTYYGGSESEAHSGYIGIYAISNLISPETVSSEVDFFMEISAGSDFELAKPTLQMADGAIIPITPAIKISDYDEVDGLKTKVAKLVVKEVIKQINRPSTMYGAEAQIEMNLVPRNSNGYAKDITMATMGERFTNLRSYMKRFSPTIQIARDNWFAYQPIFKQNDGATDLGYYGVNTIIADSTTATKQIKPSTPLSLVSNLYRFYGGGTRIKLAMTDFNQSITYGISDGFPNRALDLAPSTVAEPQFVINCLVNNLCELTIPYYSTLKSRVFGRSATAENNIQASMNINGSTTVKNVTLYEAASDDMTMFFLIGPPVMRYETSFTDLVKLTT